MPKQKTIFELQVRFLGDLDTDIDAIIGIGPGQPSKHHLLGLNKEDHYLSYTGTNSELKKVKKHWIKYAGQDLCHFIQTKMEE